MGPVSTVRFLITGRVQGVGFRWFTRREAVRLGLVGWARNLPDGRVEVMAQGTVLALEQLEAVLKSGPGFAHVENVEKVNDPHDTNIFKSFDTM